MSILEPAGIHHILLRWRGQHPRRSSYSDIRWGLSEIPTSVPRTRRRRQIQHLSILINQPKGSVLEWVGEHSRRRFRKRRRCVGSYPGCRGSIRSRSFSTSASEDQEKSQPCAKRSIGRGRTTIEVHKSRIIGNTGCGHPNTTPSLLTRSVSKRRYGSAKPS